MTLLDHAFIFFVAIVYPIVAFVSFRRLLKRVADGERVDRSQLYRNTIISHWTLFFICMVIWVSAARPWSAMGVSLEIDWWFGLAVIVTIAGIVALVMQGRHVKALSAEEIAQLRSKLGSVSIIIPQNGNELARFYGLSVTAGIVEEILWRGFLIWYLTQFMPLWVAAVISGIGFGLAHAYQGISHLPQITAVGLLFAALYVISGSIWLPIIMHAAVDILQGRLGYDVIYRSTMGGGSSSHDTDGSSELLDASG